MIADPNAEALLEAVSALCGQEIPKDWDSLPIVIDNLSPGEMNPEIAKSRGYFLTRAEESGGDLEQRIAQTVLDTHADVQPLMWNSSTASEPETEIEPPSRVKGEEPIRDPGDATPFEELRQGLQNAVDATQPLSELAEEPSTPMANETRNEAPMQPAMEYDIVLPEPDEEPTAIGPVSRTDAPETDEIENHSARRSYNNLFSKIRHKKQA